MKIGGGFVEFLVALGIQLLSLMLGAAVTMFIAFILDICGRSMSWYSNQWLIFGLYFCPFFFCNALIPYLYIKWREKSDVSDSYYVQLVSLGSSVNDVSTKISPFLGIIRPLCHSFDWARCVNGCWDSFVVYARYQYRLLLWFYINKCPFQFYQ